ncbi:hypothetical protein [Actinoplanes sp. NPDC026619]|uniref:hypothetical protein n=1 Tax=Actinoplanes sp. NPDC026619 TaxID=3155798 RepID=UPI0033C0DA27
MIGALLCGLSALSGGMPTAQALTLTGHSGNGYQDLGISGTPVQDLHPGAVRQIQVTFTNPNTFPISVYSVRGELTATSKRGCRATRVNLEVRDYRGKLPVTVPARSRRSGGTIDTFMPNSVAQACENTAFTIKLTGKATKAGR